MGDGEWVMSDGKDMSGFPHCPSPIARHGEALNRVRWRCRRGLLELDLVLARFAERHLEDLTLEEMEAFAGLLERPDLDLWELIGSTTQYGDEHANRVLGKLRAS